MGKLLNVLWQIVHGVALRQNVVPCHIIKFLKYLDFIRDKSSPKFLRDDDMLQEVRVIHHAVIEIFCT